MFLFGGYPPELAADRIIFRVPEYGQNWYNWEVIAGYADQAITDVEYLNEDTAIAVGENGSVIRTFDSWLTYDSLYTDTNRYLNAVDFIGFNYGLAVGGDSIEQIQSVKRTLDGGATWALVRDVSGSFLRSIYCLDVNDAIAVGDNGTALRTMDGGDNWSTIPVPVSSHLQQVYFLDSDVGIIVGGDVLVRTILRTIDGGDNWTTVMDEPGGMLNSVFFLDGLKGYAVGNHGQYLTTEDGGLNWTIENIPGLTSDDHLFTVNFKSDKFGMLSGDFGRYFMYTNFDQPIVQTGAVNFDNQGTTNFLGQANSGGGVASCYFLYSTDPNLINSDSTGSVIVNSTSLQPVTESEWNLLDNTTYYYTCKCSHLMGSGTGDTLSFFTDFGNGISLLTDLATDVTSASATLNAHVQNLNQPSTVWFQYNAYGQNTNTVAATPANINDGAYYDVTHALGSLLPNTTYRYRLKVVSGPSTFYGQYQQFYTGTESDVTTLPASNVTFSTATLNGFVEFLHLPTNLSFVFYPTASSGQNQIAIATPAIVTDENGYSVTANVIGLSPNTYYSCKLIAQNEYGTLEVNNQEFYTGIEDAVVTDPATGVTATSAYLNGTCIELDSYPGSAYFEYFKGSDDTITVGAWPLSISGNQEEPVQAYVDNLETDTVYVFRVKLVDNNGTVYYGKDRQVHTGSNPIPNFSFENWTPVSGTSPDNWYNMMGTAEQVSPGYAGNHAIKLTYMGDGQIGAVMNGALTDVDNGLNFLGGQPYTERPDTLSGMFKYDFALGDTGTVMIMFRREGQMISNQQFFIAGSSPSAFVEYKFPIEFDSPLTPDSVIIGIIATNLFGSGEPQIGNWLIVDELRFNGSHPNVPNNGFEEWTPFVFDHLDEWNYVDMQNNGFFPVPEEGVVRQTSSAQEGNYAAEIYNLDIAETSGMAATSPYYIGGFTNTNTNGFVGSGGQPSFGVNHTPQALHGYYKFFPENGDTLIIRCDLFEEGSVFSSQSMLEITEPASDFTPFTLDLIQYQSNDIIDSASISIATTGEVAHGASWAVVDNFRFDGFSDLSEIIVGVDETSEVIRNTSLVLYPNPGSDFVTVAMQGEGVKNAHYELVNALGKKVKTGEVISCSNGSVAFRLETNDISRGVYILRVTGHDFNASQIWIRQ